MEVSPNPLYYYISLDPNLTYPTCYMPFQMGMIHEYVNWCLKLPTFNQRHWCHLYHLISFFVFWGVCGEKKVVRCVNHTKTDIRIKFSKHCLFFYAHLFEYFLQICISTFSASCKPSSKHSGFLNATRLTLLGIAIMSVDFIKVVFLKIILFCLKFSFEIE